MPFFPIPLDEQKGAADGVAELDGAAKLSVDQLCGHPHTQSDVTDLVSDLAEKEDTANKWAVNGYAGLDGTGLGMCGDNVEVLRSAIQYILWTEE